MSTTPILKTEQDEGCETSVQTPDQSTWYVEEPILIDDHEFLAGILVILCFQYLPIPGPRLVEHLVEILSVSIGILRGH
jgi:hypothetical protein